MCRFKADTVTLDSAPVDLVNLCAQEIAKLQAEQQEHRDLQLSGDECLIVSGDENSLRFALHAIMENAVSIQCCIPSR